MSPELLKELAPAVAITLILSGIIVYMAKMSAKSVDKFQKILNDQEVWNEKQHMAKTQTFIKERERDLQRNHDLQKNYLQKSIEAIQALKEEVQKLAEAIKGLK